MKLHFLRKQKKNDILKENKKTTMMLRFQKLEKTNNILRENNNGMAFSRETKNEMKFWEKTI